MLEVLFREPQSKACRLVGHSYDYERELLHPSHAETAAGLPSPVGPIIHQCRPPTPDNTS
jgi:hypothetical protein